MRNEIILIVVFVIVISLLLTNVEAYASSDTISPLPSVVDDIKTTHLIAGVAIVGISLQTYKGMIGKKRSEFSINQLIFTSIVGIGAAIILVGNAFQNVSTDMNETELMIFLVQQVITVMGAKTITDIGKKHIGNGKSKVIDETLPSPIDYNDIPPGKDKDLGNISSTTVTKVEEEEKIQ